jgi:hypothetical protein
VPFLREKVPPSYMRLKGAAHVKTLKWFFCEKR